MAEAGSEQQVVIEHGDVRLAGTLQIPANAIGVVLFAHGSGSSRFSPRNRSVAKALNMRGLGTLLFDLLTEPEEALDATSRRFRFDIGLLTDRLVMATDWLIDSQLHEGRPLGYFGASTGAAAALAAAAQRPDAVSAVVSRGGRPDLANRALEQVRAPTLLIVGGRDEQVLMLNRQAAERMSARVRLTVIEGATHLFEEQGALEQVSQLASDWFGRQFGAPGSFSRRSQGNPPDSLPDLLDNITNLRRMHLACANHHRSRFRLQRYCAALTIGETLGRTVGYVRPLRRGARLGGGARVR